MATDNTSVTLAEARQRAAEIARDREPLERIKALWAADMALAKAQAAQHAALLADLLAGYDLEAAA